VPVVASAPAAPAPADADASALSALSQSFGSVGSAAAAATPVRGLVRFDLQTESAGSAADALLWSASAGEVVVARRAGIYRVEAGVFALSPPALTLLLNGAPVLSTTLPLPILADSGVAGRAASFLASLAADGAGDGAPASSAAAPHLAVAEIGAGATLDGGQVVLHRHPAGAVASVGFATCVALPANARLSLLFAGRSSGQAYFSLAKV
jgi:hypothetical protein